MSTVSALQTRLKELSTALAQINPLVSRLHNLTAAVGQGDAARLELGGEIHSRLRDAEDELELLKDDVDALETTTHSRRKGLDSEKENEKERVIALARRLAVDLKRTRGDFRNAQLQAKRNAETARRKERELLFTRPEGVERRNSAKEKLTQEDIVKNASKDVTTALRRTHQLMQAELSRSQFAQETLEQSGAALSSLSESYTSLDTLLSSSRNLVGSLLRSQKSDTWYLETAFYILIGTISWLIFRRVLYGPLWWVVWMPFKLVLRVVFGITGTVGASKAVQSSATTGTLVQETPVISHVPEANVHVEDAVTSQVPGMDSADRDWIIDKIGEIVEDNADKGTNLDDFSDEELQRQAEIPRNTKKRMYEATEVPQNLRDEL